MTLVAITIGCGDAVNPVAESDEDPRWIQEEGAHTFSVDTETTTTIRGGTWMTVPHGLLDSGDDHMNALINEGFRVDHQGERIFGTIMFQTAKEEGETTLGRVKIADLFPEGTGSVTPQEIYDAVRRSEIFEPALPETAAQVRRLYTNQPAGETLLVVSHRMNAVKSEEKWQFALYNSGTGDEPVQGLRSIQMSEKLDSDIVEVVVAVKSSDE